MSNFFSNLKTSRCPYSGFEIFESKDWYYIDTESSYFSQVKLINKNIILISLNGKIDQRIYDEQQAFFENIIEQLINEGEKFVLLHDYKNLYIKTGKIRLDYTKWVFNRLDKFSEVIFFNLSSVNEMYIKVGKLFSSKLKFIKIYKDYKETILELSEKYNIVDEILETKNNRLVSFEELWAKNPRYETIGINTLKYVELPEWVYTSKETDFVCRYRLYEDFVVNRILSGNQNLNDSIRSAEILEQLTSEMIQDEQMYTLIINVEDLESVTYKARRFLANWAKNKNTKVKKSVYIGSSLWLRNLIRILKVILNGYSVEFEKTKEDFFNKYPIHSGHTLKSKEVFDSYWYKYQQYILMNDEEYRIISPEKWIYNTPDQHLKIIFKCIDTNILVAEVRGSIKFEDTLQALDIFKAVINELFGKKETFYLLNDYSFLKGAGYKSRKYAADWFHRNLGSRIKLITISQSSYFVSLAIKLSVIVDKSFKTEAFDSFDKALEAILEHKRNDLISQGEGIMEKSFFENDYFHNKWLEKKEYFVVNSSKLRIIRFGETVISKNLKITTCIIDGHILMRKYMGQVDKAEQVQALVDSHNILINEYLGDNIKPIIIYDLHEVSYVSIQARKATEDWMNSVVEDVEYFIYFGQNATTRIGIIFAKMITGKFNNVLIFANKEKAFEFIESKNKENTKAIVNKASSKDERIKQLEQELAETKAVVKDNKRRLTDLFEILGRISWDETYEPVKYDIGENDMFFNVFSIVTMLQYDIQEIINEKDNLAKKAIESERLKSSFLANMSHEIRTPMNAISGFSDIILEEDNVSDETREYLNIIQRNAKQLIVLINDIIDFSKIEAGQVKVNPIKNNINEVIRNILQTFDADSKVSDIPTPDKVHLFSELFYTDDEQAYAFFDEVRVGQILTNLIQNAIKFTQKGQIIVSYIVDDKDIVFSVSDTGVGIAEDKVDKIFKRFQQADDSITREFGGTGLGLSICKGLCKIMEGNISAKSELGKGSVFSFTIPYVSVIENE